MSLKSLPTELDTSIVEYLHVSKDVQAISSLSKTSNYYRNLAEPFLYQNIDLPNAPGTKAKQLLFTLLDRPQLAKLIRTLTVSDVYPDRKTPRT